MSIMLPWTVEEGKAIPLVRVRLDSVDVLRGVSLILMALEPCEIRAASR